MSLAVDENLEKDTASGMTMRTALIAQATGRYLALDERIKVHNCSCPISNRKQQDRSVTTGEQCEGPRGGRLLSLRDAALL